MNTKSTASEIKLSELTNEVMTLRAELARVRARRAPAAWASVPLLVVGSWVLSAQAPSTAELEKRVTALESMIHLGPGNTTQVTGPFDVVGQDGKPILRVGTGDKNPGGSVYIWKSQWGGTITIRGAGGTDVAGLGQASEGHGAVYASDAKGNPRAQLSGIGGVVIFDEKLQQLAGLVTTEGRGRVGVWNNNLKVVSLDVDTEHGNAGKVSVMNAAGKILSTVGAGRDGNSGIISVMNPAGTPVAGLTGASPGGGSVVVTNTAGVGLAQMSVTDDGRGLFQVFGRGQRPIAVLTEAKEYPGGLLQILNASTPVVNVTVRPSGAGYFQMNDASGNPTVEAGTLTNGLGTVRAGPQYKCVPIQPATPIISYGVPDCIVGSTGKP